MKYLTLEQVLIFQEKIISKTGGKSGIKDIGLIDSAISRAFATFDRNELYPDKFMKIVVTTYSLVSNHGFIDGNKRIGVAVMLLLLELNNVKIIYTQDELINLGLTIAEGRIDNDDIYNWIIQHKNK